MKKNIGRKDKINRLVVGATLMIYAVYANEPIAYAGIIPLITAIVGFCPLYPLFKYSSK